ncbi:MAG: RNA methyltransferase [Flavobacteriaceae bacterium]|nr:RNA methyltransferase [Flavobacteriaceae bacterium]
MHKQISSLQNPFIKQVLLLQEKSRERKKTGLFIIEGQREIQLAIKGGYSIKTLLFCPEITSEETIKNLNILSAEVIETSLEVYKKIAYRTSTEGIVAIAGSKELHIKNLKLESLLPNYSGRSVTTDKNKSLLILVAEAPEKPGNIGAILRTADAANVDAVIIANPKTDMFNPNIIRSSVGCVFTNTIATGTTSEIIIYLKENNIDIYSAILQESVPYHTCDFKENTAIIVGTESTGLSQEWREESKANIHIPMQGEIDSMNVSVAAGILIFEAKRQRDFN